MSSASGGSSCTPWSRFVLWLDVNIYVYRKEFYSVPCSSLGMRTYGHGTSLYGLGARAYGLRVIEYMRCLARPGGGWPWLARPGSMGKAAYTERRQCAFHPALTGYLLTGKEDECGQQDRSILQTV